MIGVADGIRDKSGNKATLALARLREDRLPTIRAILGDETYAAELAAGRALPSEEAFAEAQSAVPG